MDRELLCQEKVKECLNCQLLYISRENMHGISSIFVAVSLISAMSLRPAHLKSFVMMSAKASRASWITLFEMFCVSDEGAGRTPTSIWPASDSPWARQAAGDGHRAPEFARAATLLRNLWGSRSAINKSGWGGPSGNNIFQQRSPDVMPCGLYKYPEPIRAMWTVFHPPTPFPFECLPSARSEKQALLCFVCPSALTSHFLPVNCQCSKAEHWKPHVKQISLGFTM